MAEFDGRVGHLSGIESPWANAGGVVKTLEDVEQMARTGVGWIEDGSHALDDRLGNGWNPNTQQRDRKDWNYNPQTGEMHNSLGMPGKGMDTEEQLIPEKVRLAHAYNKKLITNVAPVSDRPAEESLELISRAYAAGADGVILNAGCPNVFDKDGRPHEVLSRSPQDFARVLMYLYASDLDKPIWVRISPQDTLANMSKIMLPIISSQIVSAVITPNTWSVPMPTGPGGKPLLDVNVPTVGKSGPAMASAAAEQTAWATHLLHGTNIDVISSSGITNATELKRRLDLGAVAAAGTTFYYHSQDGWAEDTDRLLQDLAT